MNRWRCWLLVCCSLSACGSKANPAFSCSDSQCSDPNFPYCDVDGSIGGIPEACVSVTCTAGAFEACRGDSIALVCNNSGTSYDEVQCEDGCDAASGGCKLCEANQTVCQNGVVASCDANGMTTSTTHCPLGCFEDQPRCRDIDPSNALGMYLDMTSSPPDLDLTDAYFDVKTGTVTNLTNSVTVPVPTFLVAAATNGSLIRVFVANNVAIAGAHITWYASGADSPFGPAFALLARGDVTISGAIAVSPLAGGISIPGCDGGHGQIADIGTVESSGGGGGANATAGGDGGDVTGRLVGGTKGTFSGSETIIPLRGGCPGGVDIDVTAPGVLTDSVALGGGAVQISSAKSITISGTIDASGLGAGALQYNQGTGYTIGGGGAGGAILLEAPSVSLGTGAKLAVDGGAGASACTVSSATCALGGKGATQTSQATSGFDATFSGIPSVTAGGGGGGWGRIRFNTPDGSHVSSATTIEDGVVSSGLLQTR